MQVTLNYFSGYTQTTTFASRMAFFVVLAGFKLRQTTAFGLLCTKNGGLNVSKTYCTNTAEA